jgi:hypothetical protein
MSSTYPTGQLAQSLIDYQIARIKAMSKLIDELKQENERLKREAKSDETSVPPLTHYR